MVVRIAVVVLAGAVGLGAGWFSRPAPFAPVEVANRALPRDCGARRRFAVEERERLDDRIEIARLRLRLQEARRLEREGPSQGWPADLAPRFQPSTFQAAVRGVAAAEGFEVLRFDCAEYPCLAAIRVPDATGEEGNSTMDYQALFQGLRDRGHHGDSSYVSAVGGGPVRFAVFTFHTAEEGTAEEGEGFAKRLVHRSRELVAQTSEQLGASR